MKSIELGRKFSLSTRLGEPNMMDFEITLPRENWGPLMDVKKREDYTLHLVIDKENSDDSIYCYNHPETKMTSLINPTTEKLIVSCIECNTERAESNMPGEITVLGEYEIYLHCLRCQSWFERGDLLVDPEDGEVKLYCRKCNDPIAAFKKPEKEITRS